MNSDQAQQQMLEVFVLATSESRKILFDVLQQSNYQTRVLDSLSQLSHLDCSLQGCLLIESKLLENESQESLSSLETCSLTLVVFSRNSCVRAAVDAMKIGALDFVENPEQNPLLCEVINRAFEVTKKRSRFSLLFNSLTDREKEFFDLLVVGQTVKQIAAQLSISPKTGNVHRANVLKKMQVTTVAQLTHQFLEWKNRFTY